MVVSFIGFSQESPKVGLVLSGGGAKGFAHIAVLKELEKAKPKRILVTGDLFHTKINMSPTSTTLGGDFLESLSKISPVDVILGNHDMNLNNSDRYADHFLTYLAAKAK